MGRVRNIGAMTSVSGDPAVATLGLHHVRLPVSDVMRSRDWYADVFGFEPRLCLEEEDNVIGAVVAQPGGLTLGLHYAPALARALHGFCSVALSVGTFDDLTRCCTRLDAVGIAHSEPAEGHLGWFVEVPDPDGLVIQLHTVGQPAADEA
jgi:catechol 2,3-dioxygenase-like lactoylglutathione lyase family enzyme